ncbi:MAG: histidine triad nucleotide-binding protein [Actinomycetota bacterium]
MEDCLFCKFVSGEIKPDVVYDDEHVLAFRDLNPQAPTHVLIVPKEHTRDATTIQPGHGPMLAALFAAGHAIAQQEGIVESGYRMVANVGPDAGQSVYHLHVHLLGGRPMAWPPG